MSDKSDFERMARRVEAMTGKSLDALTEQDCDRVEAAYDAVTQPVIGWGQLEPDTGVLCTDIKMVVVVTNPGTSSSAISIEARPTSTRPHGEFHADVTLELEDVKRLAHQLLAAAERLS